MFQTDHPGDRITDKLSSVKSLIAFSFRSIPVMGSLASLTTRNEVGLYLRWKWVMCLFVLVCVVLLVASVLESVRWLLCGGDGSIFFFFEKTTSVISKKCPAREFIPITVLINSKKF